jgi:CRP-like cAMP-binding protein
VKPPQAANENRLLAALKPQDLKLISAGLKPVSLETGEILFEAMEDVNTVHFPLPGTIAAMVLNLRDGSSAESAMIGHEGAIGGIVSAGHKPAFTQGIVQIGGPALILPTDVLERAKQRSPTLRDHFARYADCLLAQVLQSVACNALHDFDARLARWLLAVLDRANGDKLRVTQDSIAQMLGVQRSYTTRMLGELEAQSTIRRARGVITIINRSQLEYQACECYAYIRRHFDRVLPGVYTAQVANETSGRKARDDTR